MKTRIVNLLIFAALMAVTAIAAAPGALDPTFDLDGKIAVNLGSSADPRDLFVMPDGRFVAVGDLTSNQFFVARFNPNGSLDTTFDTDGIRTAAFGGTAPLTLAVAVQSDNKIIVAGRTSQTGLSGVFAVARFNANGSFDTTFDGDGLVFTDFAASSNDQARTVAIQPDGKIVVAGTAGTTTDFGVARYNPDGSLDTTFDTDGRVTVNFGSSDNGNAVALQTDGKILVAGETFANQDYALCRLNPNGSLDTTFNTDGLVTTDIFAADRANAVSILPDGKILAAGDSDGNQLPSVVRYLTNGSLDTAFDGDGKVLVDFPSQLAVLGDMKPQIDGKIVVSLQTIVSTPPQITGGFLAARFNANGSLDTSFGTNGFVSHKVQAVNDEQPASHAILPGGKLLILGGTFSDSFISLVRLNLDPTPTQSGDFDGDGFSDYAIFRPSTAEWFILRSLDNTVQIATFGLTGDVPMDGDFDGDGRGDFAVYRPSAGQWWINRSSTGATIAFQFGTSTDRAVPGDYDKDGKTDVGLFRPSTGEWLILRSSSGGTTFFGFPFGQNGDIPITRQGF